MHSLTSELNGCGWSASRHGRFTSRGRASSALWIGGWVDLRAFLDAGVKRKIPSPHREYIYKRRIHNDAGVFVLT